MTTFLASNIPAITGADTYIGPLMTDLLLCLCEKVNDAPNPPKYCTFRIGTEAPHDIGPDDDLCCQGFAYVSLQEVFPVANDFPNPDINRLAETQCIPVSWGVTLRAAIVRCVPTGGDNGQVITNAAWEEAALQNIYDVRSLQRTACCFRDYVFNSAPLLGMSMIFNQIMPGNPLGGCIERSLDFTVQIPVCDC